jgi:hypothetical protein
VHPSPPADPQKPFEFAASATAEVRPSGNGFEVYLRYYAGGREMTKENREAPTGMVNSWTGWLEAKIASVNYSHITSLHVESGVTDKITTYVVWANQDYVFRITSPPGSGLVNEWKFNPKTRSAVIGLSPNMRVTITSNPRLLSWCIMKLFK